MRLQPRLYGYSIGGPIIKNKTFFFNSYEGREGHEVASLNTQVPTAPSGRGSPTPCPETADPVPAANDSTGTFFIGPTPRNRKLNQFTGRIDHTFSDKEIPSLGSFIIQSRSAHRAHPAGK